MAVNLPNPPPASSPSDFASPAWQNWFARLATKVRAAAQILWTQIDFTGSNITSIATRLFTDLQFTGSNLTSILTRNHNDLQNIQGGAAADYNHLTSAQVTKVNNTREVLTAARTYYVSTTGSDINGGLTVGAPFATIQHALNVVAMLDLSIYDVIIQLADGTYSQTCSIGSPWVGSGTVTLQGNLTTPANVILDFTTAAQGITILDGASLALAGMAFNNGYIQLFASSNSALYFGNVVFGATQAGGQQMHVQDSSVITATSSYSISGGAGYHLTANVTGVIRITGGITITLAGTPAFSTAFALSQGCAAILFASPVATFSGTATGVRYSVFANGVINTNTGSLTYLPGNAAGTTATGGQYL